LQENANHILLDIRDEARRLTTSVLDAGLHARLLGGLAVWLRCPSVRSGPFARSYQDMDFAIAKGAGSVFKAFLTSEGYLATRLQRPPRRHPPLLPGAGQRWSIDVVIDELTMSHSDLRGPRGRCRRSPSPTCCSASCRSGRSTERISGTALCLLADHGVS